MTENGRLFFFRCAVSVDLYAVTTDAEGRPLPTTGDISWQAIGGVDALGEAAQGFDGSEPWNTGDTWESTPAEHFAEAIVAVVNGDRLLHDDQLELSDESLAVVRLGVAE